MSRLITLPERSPFVPERQTALSEQQWEVQKQRGLYTVERGTPLAIPSDRLSTPQVFLNREFWQQDNQGRVFRRGVRFQPYRFSFQRRALEWARDHIDERIPYWYYLATLGHDLHVSAFGDLYARHFHQGWVNPFNPDQLDEPLDPTFETCPWLRSSALGFIEDLGWLRGAKVTTAFVSEEIDELVSATGSEYADFDFHEVGTSSAAEANTQTALTTTTGIARATGTPTDADPIYRSVGTITADTVETWQEHGLFNNSTGVAMMDRSLTGGQSVQIGNQVQYTYELTKNAEA